MFGSTIPLVMVLVMCSALQTIGASSTQSQEAYAGDDWLLSCQGKNTNQVRWDSRFPELLRSGLPNVLARFYDPQKPVSDVALIVLSGPPEPVVIESNRYVTLAASVPQVAELKGLLWVDTAASSPEMIFAVLNQDAGKPSQASLALFTRSSQFATKLPPQFVSSLTAWLSARGIKKITGFTMTNASGETTKLPIAILGSLVVAHARSLHKATPSDPPISSRVPVPMLPMLPMFRSLFPMFPKGSYALARIPSVPCSPRFCRPVR